MGKSVTLTQDFAVAKCISIWWKIPETVNIWYQIKQLIFDLGPTDVFEVHVICCLQNPFSFLKGKSSEKYEVGCLTKVEEFVHSEAKFVGGISIGIALIQVLGVVIACKLPKEWQKQG